MRIKYYTHFLLQDRSSSATREYCGVVKLSRVPVTVAKLPSTVSHDAAIGPAAKPALCGNR